MSTTSNLVLQSSFRVIILALKAYRTRRNWLLNRTLMPANLVPALMLISFKMSLLFLNHRFGGNLNRPDLVTISIRSVPKLRYIITVPGQQWYNWKWWAAWFSQRFTRTGEKSKRKKFLLFVCRMCVLIYYTTQSIANVSNKYSAF